MENTLLKTRIAMLWIFTVFVLFAFSTLSAYEQLGAGVSPPQLTPGYSLLSTAASLGLFAIPFLCLTLKDSWNRMANIFLGTAFTVFGIAGTASGLSQLTASNAHFTLIYGAATVAPAIIVYYSYRWPKG
ncbi:MAG: hypothetical protein OK438_06880 [Thaumarchaeota archaeon]|nr:hypothetical protein [Nitrososphaerota archaeon]